MKRGFQLYLIVLAVIVAAGVMSTPAAAQNGNSNTPAAKNPPTKDDPNNQPLPPGGPPPRLQDGHVDLSGVWYPGTTGHFDFINNPPAQRQFDPKVTPEARPQYLPAALAKIKAMSETDLELGKASTNCVPRGVPGIFINNPYPIQLVETPGQLVQLVELLNNWRVVPTDGRAHETDPDPTFNGDAVGHWEGDTLVIDVIALDERSWNDMRGWFHSDQEHVIERLSRPSMNYLIYQVTVEDPKVLAKPWTSVQRKWSLNHGRLDEYYCTHNEEVQQYNILKQEETSGKKPQ